MPVILRKEQNKDIAVIRRLIEDAFVDAPHADHTEHLIVDALRHSGMLTLSLVAEEEGDILGHVALSPVSISDGAKGWFGLGPIAVAPTVQGQGIGTKLMWAALDALQKIDANGCVLLGDPTFYRRFGFEAVDSLVLPDVPPEYFLALTFNGQFPEGDVFYHDSFYSKGIEKDD